MLVARTVGLEWPDKDKTSIPATLKIQVTPVNDAIPKIVNNTGLTVWAGSSVPIMNDNLGATDNDSPDSNLTFSISSPHCGMVSLKSRPAYPVSKFNQLQLSSGQVIFTHTGKVVLQILDSFKELTFNGHSIQYCLLISDSWTECFKSFLCFSFECGRLEPLKKIESLPNFISISALFSFLLGQNIAYLGLFHIKEFHH